MGMSLLFNMNNNGDSRSKSEKPVRSFRIDDTLGSACSACWRPADLRNSALPLFAPLICDLTGHTKKVD